MNMEETMLALLDKQWVYGDGLDAVHRFRLINGKFRDINDLLCSLEAHRSYSIYKAPDWREKIPECGVLGEFWDKPSGSIVVGVLTEYNSNLAYKYRNSTCIGYYNFKPFDEQEIRALCDEWIKAIPEVGL